MQKKIYKIQIYLFFFFHEIENCNHLWNFENMIHMTAIDYAKEANYPEIVELLSKAQENARERKHKKEDYEKQIEVLKEEHKKQLEEKEEEFKKQLDEKDKEIQKLKDMIKMLQNQS